MKIYAKPAAEAMTPVIDGNHGRAQEEVRLSGGLPSEWHSL
jgi:hypothetical protein